MNEEMQKEILSRLDVLAEKLGTTASHLWGVLVKQQALDAIGYLSFVLAFFVAAMVFLVVSNRVYEKQDKPRGIDFWDSGIAPTMWVIGWFLATISCLSLMATFSDIVSGFLNPEYGAFHEVVRILR